MIKMIEKCKIQILIAILALAVFSLQACAQFAKMQTDVPQASPMPSKTPTWTPRPKDPTALPTVTLISNTQTATPVPTRTPKKVTFTVTDGNLNVRRGPRLTYNYVGVLYDGDVAIAVGRDRLRLSRWLLIELPSNPGAKGWVTTETKYSTVEGDISSLPLVEVDVAVPAFIRNCTKHTILVQPVNVQLLNKYNEPCNEEHFYVLTYQIYDLDTPGNVRLEDITLSEGRTVDIIYDGAGEKSKCE